MHSRLEITLKPDLFDAEGAAICRKANDYFGLGVESVRTVSILTFDSELTANQLEAIRTEIFTNPVTQVSSYEPLVIDFDWVLWVGYRPGVRDNPGSTAEEAVQDLLGHTSKIRRGDLHLKKVLPEGRQPLLRRRRPHRQGASRQ